MPLFSKVFKNKDASKKVASPTANGNSSAKPKWVDSWLRTRVDPDEVAELLHGITLEIKSRALDIPLLLLPFRPSSDPSAARTFVRNYFLPPDGRSKLKGEALVAELKMTEVMVLISAMKWCWARLPGGVVSWETYKMFQIGEKDSNYARDAFAHFIPISVESNARVQVINDFFDLLASLAAHGKTNGLSGHKLSRYAGWWAFEHYDTGKGFEAGYKSWNSAADAACHMFFAYLRAQVPDAGTTNGILDLPRSLQQLVASTRYPPPSSLLSNNTTKVVMVVDVVSPTPYALLRRAKNFEYRDDDKAMQQFADYDDPVHALTDECRRVLRAISTTNDSNVSDAKTSTSLVDPSWSRFEDIGFSSALDDIGEDDMSIFGQSTLAGSGLTSINSNTRQPMIDLNRPTTPSWAEFLSTGFVDENNKTGAPILLPPDKILPPIMPQTQARGQSSQSHRKGLDASSTLEPGELASITKIAVDDAFWWVWITSLAGEEPTSRKAAFGRCAYIETALAGGQWMIMEEQVKGAAPEPVQGAYIAEKKGFFGFGSKKGRLTRRRSGLKKTTPSPEASHKEETPSSRSNVTADQQARIQKAARELSRKKTASELSNDTKRGRRDEHDAAKTASVYTIGGLTKDEASSALQWAKQYDKNAVRAQYLGDNLAGKGSSDYLLNGQASKSATTLSESAHEKTLPSVPGNTSKASLTDSKQPATPSQTPIAGKASEAVEAYPIKKEEPEESAPIPISKHAVGVAPISKQTLSTTEASSNAAQQSTSPASSRSLQPRSPDQPRRSSPSPNGKSNGIKKLFGTMRKGKDEIDASAPAENPAVAAARRALEGKVNSQPDNAASQERVKNLQGSQSVKNRVAALTQSPPQSKAQPVELAAHEEKVSVPPPPPPAAAELEADHSEPTPPVTRRDEEFDQLSRVDTNEREQADKEFSRFDQGSTAEQAVAELEAPQFQNKEAELDLSADNRAKHQSVYSAVTIPPDDSDEESISESKPASANDRWAQIRKNAADRAARTSEDQGNRSRTETRTDDGDTSGEETIESRVARIKARVAELTGNMDQARK